MISEDCGREIKTRMAMAKEAFNKKKRLLCNNIDSILRERLVKWIVKRGLRGKK